MMRALTTDQAYELDKRASADFNIPGESLMGNAGLAVASFISKQPFDQKVKSIAVVAGKGNNGGDGFSAALELNKLNFDVSVFSIYKHEKLSNDSLIFLKNAGMLKYVLLRALSRLSAKVLILSLMQSSELDFPVNFAMRSQNGSNG